MERPKVIIPALIVGAGVGVIGGVVAGHRLEAADQWATDKIARTSDCQVELPAEESIAEQLPAACQEYSYLFARERQGDGARFDENGVHETVSYSYVVPGQTEFVKRVRDYYGQSSGEYQQHHHNRQTGMALGAAICYAVGFRFTVSIGERVEQRAHNNMQKKNNYYLKLARGGATYT